LRLVEQQSPHQQGQDQADEQEEQASLEELEDSGAAMLLDVVGQLVDRAREAGELRPDVTVADVLLVIASGTPSLPDAAQQAAASERLLDILLDGLRSRGPGIPGRSVPGRSGR
jgi:hypothetical protein